MNVRDNPQIKSLAVKLFRDYFVIAPNRLADGRLMAGEVKIPSAVDWSGAMPENSWKESLLPHKEKIFEIKADKLNKTKGQQPPVAYLGMHILDLKALVLYDLVFANDVYYQERRQNMLIVGLGLDWPNSYKKLKLFSHNFEQDVLEHVIFDIFIAEVKNGKVKFYSGSDRGRKVLEASGIAEYDNIQFAGAVPEEGPDKRMLVLKDRVAGSADHGLWGELDKICLACGKCTIACPTCFCFDLQDKIDPANPRRERVRGNCFYNDFGKVAGPPAIANAQALRAGGHRELDTVRKKIYFWYAHKFVRIPAEYEYTGCVSCGRCVKTCPVGIDIFKNTAKLLN